MRRWRTLAGAEAAGLPRWRHGLFALVAGGAMAAGCQPGRSPGDVSPPRAVPPAEQSAPDSRILQVVATFSILGDMVSEVAGTAISPTVLVGFDGDAHAFEPTPADGVALAGADLIFENGLGFEPWLDDLYTASGSRARRVVVADGLEAWSGQDLQPEDEHDSASPADQDNDSASPADHDNDPAGTDPHMWQDVTMAMSMVESVTEALVQADPTNAPHFRKRSAAYLAELAGVHRGIEEAIGTIPVERRKLVTSHSSLGYFARRYGLAVIATGLGVSTADSGDPSAADLVRIVEDVRAAKVPAIFAEYMETSDLILRIAHEANVAVVSTLYTDALGQPGTDGDTYAGMMRHNGRQIAAGLTQ